MPLGWVPILGDPEKKPPPSRLMMSATLLTLLLICEIEEGRNTRTLQDPGP